MTLELLQFVPLAAAEGEAEAEGGSFLVSPGLGLMIWTLLVFGLTLLVLRKFAFPRIADALDQRRRAIEESIDHAEHTRREADSLLQEYRERLTEARHQSEEIVARARKAADRLQEEAKSDARRNSDEMIERARREIEAETRRSLSDIRKEVANLTVLATEKVARKALDPQDHQRLIEEALAEVDFDRLTGAAGGPRAANGDGSGDSPPPTGGADR
jgi:F-type H+-transporting ATPase subunit b